MPAATTADPHPQSTRKGVSALETGWRYAFVVVHACTHTPLYGCAAPRQHLRGAGGVGRGGVLRPYHFYFPLRGPGRAGRGEQGARSSESPISAPVSPLLSVSSEPNRGQHSRRKATATRRRAKSGGNNKFEPCEAGEPGRSAVADVASYGEITMSAECGRTAAIALEQGCSRSEPSEPQPMKTWEARPARSDNGTASPQAGAFAGVRGRSALSYRHRASRPHRGPRSRRPGQQRLIHGWNGGTATYLLLADHSRYATLAAPSVRYAFVARTSSRGPGRG